MLQRIRAMLRKSKKTSLSKTMIRTSLRATLAMRSGRSASARRCKPTRAATTVAMPAIAPGTLTETRTAVPCRQEAPRWTFRAKRHRQEMPSGAAPLRTRQALPSKTITARRSCSKPSWQRHRRPGRRIPMKLRMSGEMIWTQATSSFPSARKNSLTWRKERGQARGKEELLSETRTATARCTILSVQLRMTAERTARREAPSGASS
mmetsp:Transcript_8264/g.31072  ORF Transcript_8264/g.31072 Transcript_8264/m.31072 type:complete len:207 (-) Transcript_8264:1767-2387(-)